MAAYPSILVTAQVATEGDETVIRIPGHFDFPSGAVSVRQSGRDGAVTIAPVPDVTERRDAWWAFLDELSARPRDEEFMKERPMNRPPVEKDLFPDE